MSEIRRHIDLNCDLGEGYPHDAELMKYISSANIACGGHFGDRDSMKRTVELAIANNVAIGAHPSYPDQENFGRNSMKIGLNELCESILEQIGRLDEIVRTFDACLTHVKPHGALYNDSASNSELASAIAGSVAKYDDSLVFFGLAGSVSIAEAKRIGLQTCGEAFADRTYRSDGRLTPRSEPNAFVTDSSITLTNICHLIEHNTLVTTSGDELPIDAETICIHGDGPRAVEFAKTIYRGLIDRGIEICPKYDRT